jgi:thiamine pyrophosphokinase
MIINILAGGPEDLLPDLKLYDHKDVLWVGVDRGVFHLLKRNIKPSIAFGDFDSVTDEELAYIETQVSELKKFKPEKDETDMELALNFAIGENPEKIQLFGATGGRLDHLFANVQLMVDPLLKGKQNDIVLIDSKNYLFVKAPGTYSINHDPNLKYISFVPVTLAVKDLTLKGFKYPLENRHISIGSTLCISNELIDDYGTFSFSEGILLVIRNHD